MDSKVLKASLKSAVEHIKAERFSETVKTCKEILKSSPNNSRTLLYLGVAAEKLGDVANALEAHKKAISAAADDDALPWQGLRTFYEKHVPPSAEDLTVVYEKLLTLINNKQKQQDLKFKLSIHLLTRSAYDQQICEKVQLLASELEDPTQQYEVRAALASYCLNTDCSEAKLLFQRTCHTLIATSTPVEKERTVWEAYAQQLYQVEGDVNQVLKTCTLLAKSYPSSSLLSNLCATLYCQIRTGLSDIDCTELQQSIHADLLQTFMAELYNFTKDGQALPPNYPTEKLKPSLTCCASIALAKQCLQDKAYKKTREHLSVATKTVGKLVTCLEQCKVSYESLILDYSTQLAFKQHRYSEVISLHKQRKDTGHRDELIISLIETSDTQQAEQLLDMNKDEDQHLLGYMYNKNEMYDKAYQLLSKALTHSPKSARVNLWLGEVCMKLKNKEKEVAKYLLTAAKLDPENEEAFLYLGHYYNMIGDTMRGMKCIKKSYSLNPVNDRICIAYVDQLMAQGENEQVVDILSQTTKLSSSGSCKWAWFRLGSLRSGEGSFTEAINCFQQVLRADNTDSNCWECLADCYVKRGSFTAAIGAFERAFRLNPESIYSCYQISLIKYKLGQYADAQKLFLDLLAKKHDYIPALKGLGDVHISIARDAVKDSIYGKISHNISLSLRYLAKAALLRSDLSCVWKSLGDALTLSYQLPGNSMLDCPVVLMSTSNTELPKDSTQSIDVPTALSIGAKCYAQCKHLRKENSFAWHDLAVNHVYQSKLCADSVKRKTLLHAASQFALKAISLDSQVVAHYNCLGTIYLQPDFFDARAAQHYLILGVELDQNNVQGWTNLAALYLMNGDVKLAHETLNIAQSADPKYNECWTGQAIVAEMIGHEEAMDLFRHTTELGRNVESAVGYAHWVLKTLIDEKGKDSEHYRYSIEKLDAVSVSCDALGALIGWKPSCQALNAYGLLLERQGLLNMAVKALKQCVSMGAEAKDERLPLYRANLARVLCNHKDYSGCVEQLQQIDSPTVHDIAVTALVHYKMADYTKSFQFYNKLVELTEDEGMKSHTYTAMGMLAVKCDDADTAKTAFFQSSECSSPSIYGLAGLYSLGLLSGDEDLALAALDALMKCGDSKEAYILKSTFNSYMAALQGDSKCARNYLLRAIHCYPTDKTLHNQLLTMSTNYLPDYRESILRLTQGISSVQHMVALTSLACGRVKEALKQAQSALHLYPDRQENWLLVLGASYSAHVLGVVSTDVVSALIKYMSCVDYSSAKDEQQRWLAEIDVLYSLHHDMDNLQHVPQKRNKELVDSTLIAQVKAFLNQDSNALSSMDNEKLNLLLQVKLAGASRESIAAIKERSNVTGQLLQSLNLMEAKLVLQELVVKNSDELKDEFISLLEGNDSGSSLFLQSLYYWKVANKTRTAARVFEAVIEEDEGRNTEQYHIAQKFLQQKQKTM